MVPLKREPGYLVLVSFTFSKLFNLLTLNIYLDELDITLVLEEAVAQYLTFDTRNQAVRIDRDAPAGLTEYRDNRGYLDAKKLFHNFLGHVR